MKMRKIVIALCILCVQKTLAQKNNDIGEGVIFKQLDIAFNKFIDDDRSKPDSTVAICTAFNKLIKEKKIDTTLYVDYILKKHIVLLYSYCNLEYQEYTLILAPPAQKKLFDSLSANILSALPNKKYEQYAYASLGYYYDNIDRYPSEAESYYVKAFRSGKPYPALLSWRSWNYFRSDGNFETMNADSAKLWLRNCVQERPGYAIAYVCLGHFAAVDNDYAKAYSLYTKSLQLSPDLKTGHIAFAYWYEKRGFLDSAILYYEKTIQKYPRFTRAMVNLATEYKAKQTPQFYNKAIALYKKCMAIDSLESSYDDNIAEVYSDKLKQYDSALHYYKEEVRLNPPKIYLLGIFYYLVKPNYRLAVQYFNDYTKINPSGLLYAYIGDCYYYMGNDYSTQALASYEKSIELDTAMRKTSYEQLGLLYNRIYIYDSSIYYYKKLIALYPKKKYVADMGYPYRNLANDKITIDSNYLDAYKLLKDGAKNGNRGCRIVCYALQNEFGFDNANGAKNYDRAKDYYVQAAKLWPFSKLGIEGILRLYDKKNIPMEDSSEYKIWKKMKNTNSKFKEVNTYRDTSKSTLIKSSIRIWGDYPPGVHPGEWEADRLKQDYDLIIEENDYETLGKMMIDAKNSGEPLTVFGVNSSDKKIKNDIDTLVKNYEQKNDPGIMDTILGKYEERIKLKSDDEDLKYSASEAYRINSSRYFDSKNYDVAMEMATRGLEIYPSNKRLIRLLCKILVVSGKTEDAFAIYDKHRNEIYFTDDDSTYREVFLSDLYSLEQNYRDIDNEIRKAKEHLYSAKEKLQNKSITYNDILKSTDQQLLFDAAKYFDGSWNNDTLTKSLECYERLLILKDSVAYIDRYLNALARSGDIAKDKKVNKMPKNLEGIFSKSGLTDLEKLLAKWRMHVLGEAEFTDSFKLYIKKLALENSWSDLMYNAKKYRTIAEEGDNPNKNSLLFVARKTIDLYSYIYTNIPAGETDYSATIKLIAQRCGGFSYSIITLKDFNYALKAAELAHKADPEEMYAKTNLPIAFILTGHFESGKELYLTYADENFPDGLNGKPATYREIFLNDLKDLETTYGITHPDFNKIKKLLNKN